jgi:DnaJ-class molecular chaperone
MSFYEVLGIPQNATPDQIKKQYRKLSLECHPDRPNGNAEKFKAINEAYETLSDERKRSHYDHKPIDIMEMLFKTSGQDMFSQGFMFQCLMKPPPLNITVPITLDQAYTGCKVPVKIERWIHVNHIKQCEQETMYIDIMAGIDSNECMMILNKGQMGPDGTMGDVRIIIQVEPNLFERRGLDLYYTHNITLKEALCGFSFDLNYLQNKSYKINNKAGNIIQPSYKKMIPDMGMKRDGQVGQLIIAFQIIFPVSLSEETIQTLQTIL